MATRIATLLQTTPESWLRMQTAVDLWEIQQQPSTLGNIKSLPKSRLANSLAAQR
jgi:plasmid maintenance system antidote protein VapI